MEKRKRQIEAAAKAKAAAEEAQRNLERYRITGEPFPGMPAEGSGEATPSEAPASMAVRPNCCCMSRVVPHPLLKRLIPCLQALVESCCSAGWYLCHEKAVSSLPCPDAIRISKPSLSTVSNASLPSVRVSCKDPEHNIHHEHEHKHSWYASSAHAEMLVLGTPSNEHR